MNENWWKKELENLWGSSDYQRTLETRRAAKVALNQIEFLETALRDIVKDLEMRSKNGVVDCSHGVYCNALKALEYSK